MEFSKQYSKDCASQKFVATTILVTCIKILTEPELINVTFVLYFNADLVKKLILGLKIYVKVSDFALKVNFKK